MHRKYYKIADIPIEVRSELPLSESTFHPKFKQFETKKTTDERATIHHHFNGIPHFKDYSESQRLYFRPPWAIYRDQDSYIYKWIRAVSPHDNYDKLAVTNEAHSRLDIFHDDVGKKKFASGVLNSLAMFSTDQIWLSHLLSNREGCIIHSLGAILDDSGYLFVGHSDAGKSTMARLLMKEATILCDDRNIIRKSDDGFRVYGTWSHGEVPDISPLSAPLKGIFFLEKSDTNELIRVHDTADALKIFLACLIRPMVTASWLNRTLDLISEVLKKIPCWRMQFDRSGGVLNLLRGIDSGPQGRNP